MHSGSYVQAESFMKLSLKILVPESTAVAAPSDQVWQGKTLNRQSWQAEEVTLTSATAHRSKRELENLENGLHLKTASSQKGYLEGKTWEFLDIEMMSRIVI